MRIAPAYDEADAAKGTSDLTHTEEKMMAETEQETVDELREKLRSAEAENTRLIRLAEDRRYMMDAYHSMLGPKGLAVAACWDAKGVKRVHHSWGPDAALMDGEGRAQVLLDWEAAFQTAMPVESIDAPSPTQTI